MAAAQPDWSPFACLIASTCGYALFWLGCMQFKTKKGRFSVALLWFAIVSACHLNWFFADRYVGIYIYPFLALLLFGLGSQFALLTLFLKPDEKISIWGIGGGWVLCEWSRLYFFSGYTFDPVGLSLTATAPTMQMASLCGVYGMSFWVIVTNLLALRWLTAFSKRKLMSWLVAATFPPLFGIAHLAFHLNQMEKDPTPPLPVLLVQSALTPEQKQQINGSRPYTPIEQWENVLEMLSVYADEKPKLIVFPEGFVPYGTAIPLYSVEQVTSSFAHFLHSNTLLPNTQSSYVTNSYWAQGIANSLGSDVIIGLEDLSSTKTFNAAFLFRADSEEKSRYVKRILVPMGEYIPFDWCKKILSKYGILDSYTAGTEATIFNAARIPVGISICYEETFGNLMLENVKKGQKCISI